MASLFKRPGSPFWWIKFRDPNNPVYGANGKEIPRRESTGFRFGNGQEIRKARELEARRTLAERTVSSGSQQERFVVWVDDFMDRRYRNSPKSLTRYRTAWRTLRLYLDERGLFLPRQITYRHCEDYFEWREKPDKRNGKYAAGRNTAIVEMKFFALVMKQAVRMGFAQGNPARELGFSRIPAKLYAEYTDEDLQQIVGAIRSEPETKRDFLWPSFLIAFHHGVRLSETNVNPLRDVRFWKVDGQTLASITFRQKGNRIRTKPLHPELISFFEELMMRRRQETFPVPKSFAKEWHKFFRRCGLKSKKLADLDGTQGSACFHSLRVTAENRLRRAGVAKEVRMRYLSHESNRFESNKDVNAIYDRFLDTELRVCHAPLNSVWK